VRMLVIDNETIRQRNLRAILSSLGYKSAEVESVDDPINGITLMKKKAYDCVFVYMYFPKMSGLDFVKELRVHTRLKSVPVVVYSNEVSKENVIACVQAGANGFLGYPFSVSDVESSIKQAFPAGKK
jgi:CheY-like chemotaxis protein